METETDADAIAADTKGYEGFLIEDCHLEFVGVAERASEGKFGLAKRAKALKLDAIHDPVHEMARDEARHGKAFEGLLARYFG